MKTQALAKALLKVGLRLIAPGLSEVATEIVGQGGDLLIDARAEASAKKVTDSLLDAIERDLQAFAAAEGLADADAERLMDVLRELVVSHPPRPEDWARAGFDPARLTAILLDDGKQDLCDLSDDDRSLVSRLAQTFYARLAREREVLARLESDFRSAVLGRIDALPALLGTMTADETRRVGRAMATALLAVPRRPWRPGVSPPGALLRADIDGPVPFHGRADELASLEAWCDEAGPLALRLYTGAGGMGKSRLLVEACGRAAARGWRAGFVDRRFAQATTAVTAALLDGADVFVVVDYAETRRPELETLLRAAFASDAPHRIRIVLLARSAEDWWDQLKSGGDGIGDLVAGPATQWLSLRPLASTVAEREASYREARDHFARRLGKAASDETPDDLQAAHYDAVLLLHMRALAAVEGVVVKGDQGVLDYVLDRERRYWNERAQANGIPDILQRAIGQAMAAVTLGGGARDPASALALFHRIARLADQPHAVVAAVSEMLHQAYPGELWIEPIQPDLLGEHLVQSEMEDASDDLLDLVFGARADP